MSPPAQSLGLREERPARWLIRIEKALYARGILAPARQRLPDFLVIGAMKAGTTWLYENLRLHPQIHLPEEKENDYFAFHFHTDSLSWYARHFRGAGGRLKGDVSPLYYALLPHRIRFMRTVMPDAKVVFMLRDPVERDWSEAYMQLVEKKGRRLGDVPDQAFCDYLESPPARKRGDLLSALDAWHRVFAPEQVFVALYDDLKRRPRGLLEDLFAFLGVSADVDWAGFPYQARILPRYEKVGGVQRGTVNDSRPDSSKVMPAAVRRYLERRHAAQVRALQQRLGARVAHWVRD